MATDFTFKNVPSCVINKNYKLNEWPQDYGEAGLTGFSYTSLIMNNSFIIGVLAKHNLYYSPTREQFFSFLLDVNVTYMHLVLRSIREPEYVIDKTEQEVVLLLNDIYHSGGNIDWIEE